MGSVLFLEASHDGPDLSGTMARPPDGSNILSHVFGTLVFYSVVS